MYCRKCGKVISENLEYCEECRAELRNNTKDNLSQSEHPQQFGYDNAGFQRKKCCPKCKSRNLQIVTNTEFHSETKGGGFSAGKGCCGYMALGPLGLLCGACGSKSKTTVTSSSTNVWVCRDCGNKFRDIADIDADIEKRKRQKKILVPLCIVSSAFFLFMPVIFAITVAGSRWTRMMSLSDSSFSLNLFGSVAMAAGAFIANRNVNNCIAVLEEEKRYIEINGYVE